MIKLTCLIALLTWFFSARWFYHYEDRSLEPMDLLGVVVMGFVTTVLLGIFGFLVVVLLAGLFGLWP